MAKRPQDRPASAAEVAALLAPHCCGAGAVLPRKDGDWAMLPPGAGRQWVPRAEPALATPAAPVSLPQPVAPERGWTLPPEPLSAVAASSPSLVQPQSGPERGWTLTAEPYPLAPSPVAAPVSEQSLRIQRWLLLATLVSIGLLVLAVLLLALWSR
jgi:hypothetical protein